MNSIEYFEENKDKILETAKFLCKKDSSTSVEEKFKELKLQYYNNEGCYHSETIKIDNIELNIHKYLEEIRHEPIENFIIFAFFNNSLYQIYKNIGNQFSSNGIDLNDIDKTIVNLLTFNRINSFGIYILHNHPFIYKASPSLADFETLEAIVIELKKIEKEAQSIGMKCQIDFIDFAIVTEFDYCSMIQMNNK